MNHPSARAHAWAHPPFRITHATFLSTNPFRHTDSKSIQKLTCMGQATMQELHHCSVGGLPTIESSILHRLPHQDIHSAENCKPHASPPPEQSVLSQVVRGTRGTRWLPACRANLEIVKRWSTHGRQGYEPWFRANMSVPEPGPIGARPQAELADASHDFHQRTDFEQKCAVCN